jgi:hypothetical protein
MKFEYLIFNRVEMTSADEAEIRHEFLVLASVGTAALLTAAELKRDRSDVVGRDRTPSEAVETSPEDGAKHAITGNFPVFAHNANPQSFTSKTTRFG